MFAIGLGGPPPTGLNIRRPEMLSVCNDRGTEIKSRFQNINCEIGLHLSGKQQRPSDLMKVYGQFEIVSNLEKAVITLRWCLICEN